LSNKKDAKEPIQRGLISSSDLSKSGKRKRVGIATQISSDDLAQSQLSKKAKQKTKKP
jgi:hypothetical protein